MSNINTIYNNAIALKAFFSEETKTKIEQYEKLPDGGYDSKHPTMETAYARFFRQLTDMVAEEEMVKSAKEGTGTAVMKYAKSIMKAGVKSGREQLGYAFTYPENGDNRQYFCDGHRMLRLTEHLKTEYYERDNKIPLPRLFNDQLSGENPELEIPDVTKLALYHKKQKAEGKAEREIIYSFGEGLPSVEADWLLEALRMIKEPTIKACYYMTSKNSYINIIVSSKDGKVETIIMGIIRYDGVCSKTEL